MYTIQINEHILHVSEEQLDQMNISKIGTDRYHIIHHNKNYQFTISDISIENKSVDLEIKKVKKKVFIQSPVQQLIQTLGYNSSKSKLSSALLAPMPGMVLEVKVQPGNNVKKGDHLITLEAMKMENILKATHDGIIREINIIKGDKVEKNMVLITFE